MRVLVLGSGGREHAISWKLAQSSMLTKLYIAPGNAGTANEGENVDLNVNDFKSIKKFVLDNEVTIVVVGPEDPLVNGIQDFFSEDPDLNGVTLIGPSKAGAQLEGSKEFSKKFMKKFNIPTAKYQSFSKETLEQGYDFLASLKAPYVLKADGLAGGKGVLILDNLEEAKVELKNMLVDAKFGAASNKVVIEEFLDGIEISVFVLTDGDSYKVLPSAKDYKRIGEGDTGLNTGGMGAVSPVPFADRTFMDKVDSRIIIPTIKGLKQEGIKYQGFIFFGLMVVRNEPYVIEYNVRMGDPETEVVIPRLKSDLLDLFEGIATGTLSERDVEIDERTACTLMMVSGGYPEAYEKGKSISGIKSTNDSVVFHAGTKNEGGDIVTNGGRVLAITSYGKDIQGALEQSYTVADKIKFEKSYFRKDIGKDLMQFENA